MYVKKSEPQMKLVTQSTLPSQGWLPSANHHARCWTLLPHVVFRVGLQLVPKYPVARVVFAVPLLRLKSNKNMFPSNCGNTKI